MRGKRFEETRRGRDVCHQRYVKGDKSGTVLARACEISGRIWDHHIGSSTNCDIRFLIPDMRIEMVTTFLIVAIFNVVVSYSSTISIRYISIARTELSPSLDRCVTTGIHPSSQ